jgi:hypothetical protein
LTIGDGPNGRYVTCRCPATSVTDALPIYYLPLQLPYPALTQLQELKIHSFQFQEPGSSSVSADTAHWQQQQHLAAHQHTSFQGSSSSTRDGQSSLPHLTSLTALTLSHVKYGLSDNLAGLSALTGLQQLLLGHLQLPRL